MLSDEEIALRYLEQLPWPPYPFQEQAILSWFDGEDGLLVCAPTGTGKTVIAETALYEALLKGRKAYYTTPLIALTEQKFRELQEAAVRWGFQATDVGLVTGNRKENADARILVVVAEILLNRLLSPDEASFDDVSAVVMDEFHSFNDPERGIVWELSLGLLPKHCRLLLLSATVGNAYDFTAWLIRQHDRRLKLLQSDERRVPLDFRWVPDELLTEQLELMADGDESSRYTPALVFCFNRSECWAVAEQLKGRRLLADGQQSALLAELERTDWSTGAGGKLKALLLRGVGLHHAGIMPKYRRAIERLFQQKLLSICVCTETLAAGINLPARSVVMTSLLKGPPGAMKLIDASSAHQMFGRAGRPQFDTRGYVFAVAHEDDVKIHRFQQKLDQIPDDTRDPHLIKAKKNLRKKMPKRRDGQQYWSERQFQSLRDAPPAKLASRGRFPWRLLAWLIRKSGTVATLQDAVRRRLLDPAEKDDAEQQLLRMLRTMDAGGFVTLEPPPPDRSPTAVTGTAPAGADPRVFHSQLAGDATAELLERLGRETSAAFSRWSSAHLPPVVDEPPAEATDTESAPTSEPLEDFGDGLDDDEPDRDHGNSPPEAGSAAHAGSGTRQSSGNSDVAPLDERHSQPDHARPEFSGPDAATTSSSGLFGRLLSEARSGTKATRHESPRETKSAKPAPITPAQRPAPEWSPRLAIATPQLALLFPFRSVNPLYAVFLAEHMHRANSEERLQLLESVLDVPASVAGQMRVPPVEIMPEGPLSAEFLNPLLLSRGLVTQQDLTGWFDEVNRRKVWPLPFSDRMRLLFQSDYPGVEDIAQRSVWCVGDLLRYDGNFDKYVRTRDLVKQEGLVFRHCLRMILLCGEFAQLEPPGLDPREWRSDLAELASILTRSCRSVDPASTNDVVTALEHAGNVLTL
jgi:superfamily II DNA/RNA helicase